MAIPEGYEKLAVIGIAYKGEYDPETEYHIMNAVYYEGSTYVALKEHPEGVPTADGANWMYLAKGFIQNMLDTVNAKDTSGLLGEPGGVVSAQTLMDKIADKMTKELVTNTALQNKLANYILKSQIVNNLLATQPGNPLDATQGKILADKFAQLNSEFGALKSTTSAATLEDVKDILTSEFNKLGIGHFILLRLGFSASFPPFYGGSHVVFLARMLDKHGIAQFTCYSTSGVRLIYMSCNNGSWNEPVAK